LTQQTPNNQNLTAVIAGAGSIGARHAQNLLDLGVGKIFVTDPDAQRLQEITTSLGINSSDSLAEALDHDVDMTLICSPSSEHLAQAELAVSSGVTTFIEKPITHSSEGVEGLLNIADENSVNILVGCNFRFDSGYEIVREVITSNRIGNVYGFRANFGQYLPDWRPGRLYLETYSAHSVQGGGIVLDQIHEIDTITSLLGKAESVSAKVRTTGELEIHADNVADILLQLENEIVGTLHLDSLRRDYDRSIEIMGSDGTVRWSFQNNHVSLFNADGGWQELSPSKSHDFNKMYLDEMDHFTRVAQGIETPNLTGRDALTALLVAEAAQEASISGNTISL
jgi:predicted dehydrogenase